MASPWNQHCASCIGTLSFPIATVWRQAVGLGTRERRYDPSRFCVDDDDDEYK